MDKASCARGIGLGQLSSRREPWILHRPERGSRFFFSRATMTQASQTAGRKFILALMLLLAVAASLVSFSYDADAQDDIPPVTVELKFLPQAPIVNQNAVRSPLAIAPVILVSPIVNVLSVSLPVSARPVPQLSLQLSPTLRC